MAKHEWEIPMIAIGDTGPLAVIIRKEVYDDLLQVLREADADLVGMQERWHRGQFEIAADRKAAEETRKHINRVYEALTGYDLKGDSSDNTR